MTAETTRRLKQVATTLNVGMSVIVDFLLSKGYVVENKPTTKITAELFTLLAEEFNPSMLPNAGLSGFKHVSKIQKTGNDKVHKSSLSHYMDFMRHLLEAPTRQNKVFKLKKVAAALGTNANVILRILQNSGCSLENSTNITLSIKQLEFITEHFAVDIDIAIARSDAPSLELDFSSDLKSNNVGSSRHNSREQKTALRIAYIYLKIKNKPKKPKAFFPSTKSWIKTIITPHLFHVFSGEDEHRVASIQRSFSFTL